MLTYYEQQSPCYLGFLLILYKNQPDFLKERIGWLKRVCGKEKIQAWFDLIDAKDWATFVADMLETHYDPTYSRSMDRLADRVSQRHYLESLKSTDLLGFIDTLAEHSPN